LIAAVGGALLIGMIAIAIVHCRKRRGEVRFVANAHSTQESTDSNPAATSMLGTPLLFPISPSHSGHQESANPYETINESCLDTYAVPAELPTQRKPQGPYLIPSRAVAAQRTCDRPWDSAYELERKSGASVKPPAVTSNEEGAVYSLASSQPAYESVLYLQRHGSMAKDEDA
jgi:hypothetical protein